MPDPCTYVTERATGGPCEYEGDRFEGNPCGDEPEDNWQKHYGPCEDPECGDYHHAYLGPVLARCGLEQRQHCTPQRLRLDAHGHHAYTDAIVALLAG